MKGIDIHDGDKIKHWTVLRRVENYKRERAYLCQCKCGVKKVLPSQKLRSETECFMCKECSYDAMCKHGNARQSRRGKRHPIYIAWDNMLRRCENESHPSYKLYGARGVCVCEEWHDYKTFRTWCLANGWGKGLSIDRVDNNKGYSPDNCRWTTQKVQVLNSRTTKWVTINGKTKTRGEWLKEYDVSGQFVYDRIKKFNVSFEEAIQMPRLRPKKGKK